jgi:acid stress-induced BolA-like protein IbaG/YrbA
VGSSVHSGYTPRTYDSQRGLVAIFHIMEPVEIARLIEAGFSDAIVTVKSDDNTHFGALVVASEFGGKRLLARHQLVYQSLGALVGNEIHALSITALTPDEWRERSGEA